MNKYECITICANDVPAEKAAQITDKIKSIITDQKGEVLTVNVWGKKRLAYPIAGNFEGFYTQIDFAAPPQTIAKLENYLKLTEEIIRHLMVRKSEKKKLFRLSKTETPVVAQQAAVNAVTAAPAADETKPAGI